MKSLISILSVVLLFRGFTVEAIVVPKNVMKRIYTFTLVCVIAITGISGVSASEVPTGWMSKDTFFSECMSHELGGDKVCQCVYEKRFSERSDERIEYGQRKLDEHKRLKMDVVEGFFKKDPAASPARIQEICALAEPWFVQEAELSKRASIGQANMMDRTNFDLNVTAPISRAMGEKARSYGMSEDSVGYLNKPGAYCALVKKKEQLERELSYYKAGYRSDLNADSIIRGAVVSDNECKDVFMKDR